MSEPLVLEQHVAAEPGEVYAAWVSAERLAAWWWPNMPDATYQVDARVGGRYEISSQTRGIGVRGQFLELEEPRAIRMTWCWLNDGVSEVEEEVDVEFAARDGGTRVTVTHHLADGVDGKSLRQGWRDVLNRLPEGAARAGAGEA